MIIDGPGEQMGRKGERDTETDMSFRKYQQMSDTSTAESVVSSVALLPISRRDRDSDHGCEACGKGKVC